ncbi:ABC transporter permease [Streptomyces thermolilacinus]
MRKVCVKYKDSSVQKTKHLAAGQTLRVVRLAARTGWADFRRRYTWWSWLTAWVLRGALEVLFFASIGLLLKNEDVFLYLLVARALLVGVTETMLAVQTVSWERQEGTLDHLLMSQVPTWSAFLGRSLQWIPSAVATPLLLLFGLGPLLGLSYSWSTAGVTVLSVLVSAMASFGFAMFIAALVVRWPDARNLVANVAVAMTALLCGGFVPTSTWPGAVQGAASLVPFTHIVGVVSDAVLRNMTDFAWQRLTVTCIIGFLWLIVGLVALERFAEKGRLSPSSRATD